MNFEFNITSLDQTQDFAKKLAKNLTPQDVIIMKGDLGSGKTTLSKYIISYLLGKDTAVTSPTFQLLQIYSNKKVSFPTLDQGFHANDTTIYHYDLYRLKHRDEIYELGIEDALQGKNIVIIEWPEIIMQILPKKIIEIEILLENNYRKYIVRDSSNKLLL